MRRAHRAYRGRYRSSLLLGRRQSRADRGRAGVILRLAGQRRCQNYRRVDRRRFACRWWWACFMEGGFYSSMGGLSQAVTLDTADLAVVFCWCVREEVMFRGYLQATLTRGSGFLESPSCLRAFRSGHIPNAGETVVGVLGVMTPFVAVLFCCGSPVRSGWDRISCGLWTGRNPSLRHAASGIHARALVQPLTRWAPLDERGKRRTEGGLLWAPPFVVWDSCVFLGLRRAGDIRGGTTSWGPPVRNTVVSA